MTTTSKETNSPYATLRDGALKATIWPNTNSEGRIRYSVNFTRSYTDADGKWHDSASFGRNELLRLARLANRAYDTIAEAYAAEGSNADAGEAS